MTIKELKTEKFDSVFSLLEEADLQYSDLKQPNIRLFQIEENEQVIGVGGLETADHCALLRSVAVKEELRGKGVGKEIVKLIEKAASQSGIQTLFLLTKTAPGFFESVGYRRILRDEFAEPLKQTAQFSGLCPVSAVCMRKEI